MRTATSQSSFVELSCIQFPHAYLKLLGLRMEVVQHVVHGVAVLEQLFLQRKDLCFVGWGIYYHFLYEYAIRRGNERRALRLPSVLPFSPLPPFCAPPRIILQEENEQFEENSLYQRSYLTSPLLWYPHGRTLKNSRICKEIRDKVE